MQLTDAKVRELSRKLLLSRFRILNDYGFYGLLLMHLDSPRLDMECKTAYTDARRICFNPEFLDELSPSELDFIMMHEILHVVLKHCFRGRTYHPELFNIACDIVVNSNILKSHGMDESSITHHKYGVSMHQVPDGREGYLFTAEEVYQMLLLDMGLNPNNPGQGPGSGEEDADGGQEGADGPEGESQNGSGKDGKKPGKGKGSGKGKGKPNGKSGVGRYGETIDDHQHWDDIQGHDGDDFEDEWAARLEDAYRAMQKRIENGGKSAGDIPEGALRLVQELTDSTVDWRTLLNDFLTFDITDYSFTPPDRRYEGPFFMPDFSEKEESVMDVLFMADTSGSITDEDLKDAYSEIKGAIDQFDGRLRGKLGFFDCSPYEAQDFDNVEDLLKIRPRGGGGTDFYCIFKYVKKLEKAPAAIIILTDGYADFPPEEIRGEIPVLWLINNKEVTPPWGIIARMIHKKGA